MTFPRIIKDRVVEHPSRYEMIAVPGQVNQFDLTRKPGVVSQSGTTMNKDYFQPIEDELAKLNEELNIESKSNLIEESVFPTQVGGSAYKDSVHEGFAPEFIVNGKSVVQLVSNGNFADGATGWLLSGAVLSALNNIGIMLSSVYGGNVSTKINIIPNIGDKIFVLANVKADSPLVYLQYFDGTSIPKFFHSGSGLYENLSFIHTTINNVENKAYIKDSRASGWTDIDIKNFIAIKLEGADLLLSADELANKYASNGYLETGLNSAQGDVEVTGEDMDSQKVTTPTMRSTAGGIKDSYNVLSGIFIQRTEIVNDEVVELSEYITTQIESEQFNLVPKGTINADSFFEIDYKVNLNASSQRNSNSESVVRVEQESDRKSAENKVEIEKNSTELEEISSVVWSNAEQITENYYNVEENKSNLDILRLAKKSTGTVNAYILDSASTFERIDGNTLPFIPSMSNTGPSTMAEDGHIAATIVKFDVGTDSFLSLEGGEILKNNRIVPTWSSSESAFILAPKTGGALQQIQYLKLTEVPKHPDATPTMVNYGSAIGIQFQLSSPILGSVGGSRTYEFVSSISGYFRYTATAYRELEDGYSISQSGVLLKLIRKSDGVVLTESVRVFDSGDKWAYLNAIGADLDKGETYIFEVLFPWGSSLGVDNGQLADIALTNQSLRVALRGKQLNPV